MVERIEASAIYEDFIDRGYYTQEGVDPASQIPQRLSQCVDRPAALRHGLTSYGVTHIADNGHFRHVPSWIRCQTSKAGCAVWGIIVFARAAEQHPQLLLAALIYPHVEGGDISFDTGNRTSAVMTETQQPRTIRTIFADCARSLFSRRRVVI